MNSSCLCVYNPYACIEGLVVQVEMKKTRNFEVYGLPEKDGNVACVQQCSPEWLRGFAARELWRVSLSFYI